MIDRLAFTPAGERDFKKLSRQLQTRMLDKLRVYLASGTPLVFAKPLVNLPPATHRFRVGKYRVCFYLEGSILVIDGVNTRQDAYRRR